MNALVGQGSSGDFRRDVMHLNLHKTFSTAAWRWWAGIGSVCNQEKNSSHFCRSPVLVTNLMATLGFEYSRPQSVAACARSTETRICSFARSPTSSQRARWSARKPRKMPCLNANYIRKGPRRRLRFALFHADHARSCFQATTEREKKASPRPWTSPKRLIDYGFHPLLHGVSADCAGRADDRADRKRVKEEMDYFIEAISRLRKEVEEDPQTVLDAPHSTRVSRLDELRAARKPVLDGSGGVDFVAPASRQPDESARSGSRRDGGRYENQQSAIVSLISLKPSPTARVVSQSILSVHRSPTCRKRW